MLAKSVSRRSHRGLKLNPWRSFSVDETSVKEVGSFLFSLSAVEALRICSWLREGCTSTLSFVWQHTPPILARSVFVLHGHRLCRHVVVVDRLCCDLEIG